MREWIEANLDRLYGFAYTLAQDSDQARDLVQECALKALEASNRPDRPDAYRAWLFRILHNAFIDRCRKRGPEVLVDEMDEIGAGDDVGWTGDQHIVDVVTIRLAVAKLPDAYREIIALVDLAGLSYAEAADTLRCAEGTVMSRLSRARKALLCLIEDDNVRPMVRSSSKRGHG